MKRRVKIDYNAPFCLTFSFICMATYIAGMLTDNWTTENIFSLSGSAWFGDWTLYPRIVLHALGHVSAPHLFANLTVLLLVGPLLEETYGSGILLLISVLTAVITGFIMIVFFSGSLLGASGIVFAFIILSSFANARSGTIPLTFILICLIFIGGEIIRAMGRDNIAQFAHIVGGILGGAAGFLIARQAEKRS